MDIEIWNFGLLSPEDYILMQNMRNLILIQRRAVVLWANRLRCLPQCGFFPFFLFLATSEFGKWRRSYDQVKNIFFVVDREIQVEGKELEKR